MGAELNFALAASLHLSMAARVVWGTRVSHATSKRVVCLRRFTWMGLMLGSDGANEYFCNYIATYESACALTTTLLLLLGSGSARTEPQSDGSDGGGRPITRSCNVFI